MTNWDENDLYTRVGGADALVATVFCPPFVERPEILTWGDRSFVRGADGRYREAFSCPAYTREEIRRGGQEGALT